MKRYLLLLSIFAIFVACSETTDLLPLDDGKDIKNPIPDDVVTTPCDFDFNTAQAGDTLNINCKHDLKGENIFLPPNVVINYYNGEIINGNLFFEEAGKIDGRLLNYQLEVAGKVTLLEPIFLFEKEKWNITEGEVGDEVALVNKNMIQKAIDDTKRLGVETFEIDELDAYFLVTSEQNLVNAFGDAINIPSDFNFEMSDNTNLKVQPNRYYCYNLISIRDASNIKINGGNLVGDRDTHDYTPIIFNGRTYKTHEWGILLNIASGINIEVTNMNLSYGSGDGLNIHSTKHTYKPDYVGSSNITISNCTFDSNRRNNISITDGDNILVENNTLLNAGIDTQHSKGTAPKYGLDVEAHRGRGEDGEVIYYQRAKNIFIRDNIEKGGANGAFIVAIGESVTIENNTTENCIAFSAASNVKIKGNKITAGLRKDIGILAGKSGGYSWSTFNNEVSGNTITGFNNGIMIHNKDVDVSKNIINNCITGISLRNLDNANIFENIIKSDRSEHCYGIYGLLSNIDNTELLENDIQVNYKSIAFTNVNNEEESINNIVTIKSNNLNGGEISISNSNGIVIE